MKTELQRHMASPAGWIMVRLSRVRRQFCHVFSDHEHSQGVVFKSPRYGAYTELFAGFSPSIKEKDNGGFIFPWGRNGSIPDHISKGMKTEAEGGTGRVKYFYDWCERQTKAYV